MRVLVGCEFSGRVRDAFIAQGHEAWSCDVVPTEAPGPHIQGDLLHVIDAGWDVLIAFPPCTYLSKAGARWWPERQAEQAEALAFVRAIMAAPVQRIAIENPVGRISTAIRRPDQIVEPFHHGEPWRKATCLWLKGLPPLVPTRQVQPTGYWIGGDARKHGAHRDPHKRSLTFLGIARAMAEQWGNVNKQPEVAA